MKGQRKLTAVCVAMLFYFFPFLLSLQNAEVANAVKTMYPIYAAAVTGALGWFFQSNGKEYQNTTPKE